MDNLTIEQVYNHIRTIFRICEGNKDPKEVLASQVQKYREVFKKSVEQVFSCEILCNGSTAECV